MTEDMRERFEKWAQDEGAPYNFAQASDGSYCSVPAHWIWMAWQAALSSAGTSGTADNRLSAMLYRSLERLSLAIAACAHIGFEESSPTTNEHHASIWLDLNEAQKDAKLKLKHYAQFVRGDSLSGKGEATSTLVTGPRPINKTAPELNYKDEIRQGLRKRCGHIAECDCTDGAFIPEASAPDRAEELAREIHCPNCINCIVKKGPANQCASEIERIASLLRDAMGRTFGHCDMPHHLSVPVPNRTALTQARHEQSDSCRNWRLCAVAAAPPREGG